MKFTIDEFRAWKHKSVTLLGMSGVGKTHLSTLLRGHFWFHYSGDYRIGTRYLDEPIMDLIKEQAMQVPFLRYLLRSVSIQVVNNITVDNLQPVSSFLGKLGNSMRAAQNHYNDTLTSIVGQQGLLGKVRKFKDVSAKANRDIPELEPIHDELELERLEVIAIEQDREQAPEDVSPPAPTAATRNVTPINSDNKS